MSSPDVTPYVDLTIYDPDVQALYERASLYVQTIMPDWEPKETNTEVVLMEALSLIVAETVFAINRLPNSVSEVLFKLFGLNRNVGTFPSFTADVSVIDHANTLTVPAGYEIVYSLGDGGETAVFRLDTALSFPAGTNTQSGTFTGNLRTTRYNNLPAGTNFTVVSPLYYLSSIISTTSISGGGEPETDSEYFQRAITRFARLSDALVLPRHFSNYALEKSYVSTAKTIDLYDSSGGTAGSDYGHVALFVFGDNEYVSSANKTTLDDEIAERSLASVSISVNNPDNLAVVGVHGTVVRTASAQQATVSNAIRASLDSYLHTTAWPWSKVVRWTNIVSLIENTAGVDYVKDTGASVDLELSLNKFDWSRYHMYDDTKLTTNFGSGSGNSRQFSSDVTYTDVGGSLLTTQTASTGSAITTYASSNYSTGVDVVAGNEYWAGMRVYIPSSQSGRSIEVSIGWASSTTTLISQVSLGTITTISGSWVSIFDRVTAPSGAIYAFLRFDCTTSELGESHYLDAFTIAEFQAANNDLTISGEAPLVDLGEIDITVEAPA